jgi:hypothetical protein
MALVRWVAAQRRACGSGCGIDNSGALRELAGAIWTNAAVSWTINGALAHLGLHASRLAARSTLCVASAVRRPGETSRVASGKRHAHLLRLPVYYILPLK